MVRDCFLEGTTLKLSFAGCTAERRGYEKALRRQPLEPLQEAKVSAADFLPGLNERDKQDSDVPVWRPW